MNVIKVIGYLWPIIKILVKVFKPQLITLLEVLHDNIDTYAKEHFSSVSKPEKSIKKAELFDQQAEEILKENKINLEESELNLVREIIHTTCEVKKEK